MFNGLSGKVKSETKNIRAEAKKKTIGYILAGFSLVAGLAWNDAIKAFIEEVFVLGKDSLVAKFSYAAIITLLVVVVSMYLARLLEKDTGQDA